MMQRGVSSSFRWTFAASMIHVALFMAARTCSDVERSHTCLRPLSPIFSHARRIEEIDLLPEPTPVKPPPSQVESRSVQGRVVTRSSKNARPSKPTAIDEPRVGGAGGVTVDPDAGFDEGGDVGDPLFDGGSLLTIMRGLDGSPIASTTAPRARDVAPNEAARSLEAALTAEDVSGARDREARFVASKVRTVWRRAPVPDGTRTRIDVDIDANGRVTRLSVSRASGGTESVWRGMAAELRAELGAAIDLGPSARHAGVRVTIEARVLHVYANGTDGTPVLGSCPTMPLVGGEKPAPFGAIGGAAYGDLPNGSCVLTDGPQTMKHIEVRTDASSTFPGSNPPPLRSHLEAAWPIPKPHMPSLEEILMRAFTDDR